MIYRTRGKPGKHTYRIYCRVAGPDIEWQYHNSTFGWNVQRAMTLATFMARFDLVFECSRRN